MKIGIMQPYFFPYLGYWQLMNVVDKYVIYDDVNYIKGGWINRNRILSNGKPIYFNLGLIGASPNKLINDININMDNRMINKNLKTIIGCYSKAPYFNDVFPLIKKIMEHRDINLANYLKFSIEIIAHYLNIDTKIICSSTIEKDNHKKGQDKVIDICKKLNADSYYNSFGGKELYSFDDFKQNNIQLIFLKANLPEYKQYKNEFIPGLSIIDILMFNDQKTCINMLNDYQVVINNEI